MTSEGATLGCVQFATIYQDPTVETPPTANAPAAARRRSAELTEWAGAICRDCPVLVACLYRAVVEHDVAGFVAGTTERQRLEIRRRLGIDVEPEDFDTLAGVTRGHRQVDHAEVVRMRRANPHESLERLANRLGCSLSTVKRHLRRERNAPSVATQPTARPSLSDVLEIAEEVTGRRCRAESVAA